MSIPRPVWLLGWVSLATDAASEAIYPLLPFFLTRVLGAGAISLGIVEGAAEAANSVLKVLSGRLADRSRSKRPLVLAGYTISSAIRPFIAVAGTWTHVFAVRLVDRVGKGVRSAPRDAMLAGWAAPENRGRIFGFHRGMDHAGAVVGPILASAFLFFYPGEYRLLFALTVVPGAIAVGLIFLVREGHDGQPGAAPAAVAAARTVSTDGPDSATASLPPAFSRFMLVLSLFTLGNSTDAFLLLKLTDAGASTAVVPLMWSALHVVKASVSMVGGIWSDRIGRRAVIALGWLVYAAVYAGFATAASLWTLFAWFMLYGFYFGLTEGTEKALVADLAPHTRRGFAFGLYTAVQGLGALAASVLFGVVWTAFGSAYAFGLGASLALLSTALLFVAVPRRLV